MAARGKKKLTPLESLIMDAVWELKQASVKQVQEHLKSSKPMAYNTVMTMMQIMREKGFLISKREGKKDVYRAKISKDQMAKHGIREMLDRFFAGSTSAFISQLLDNENISSEEIKAIRKEIEKKLEK